MIENTEIVGYIASAIVLLSFLMKKMKNLRLVNTVGCIAFILYGTLINSIPLIVTNAVIVLIHMYYLRPVGKEN
jgi:uncharacterized protein with PQ loop repeat